MGFGLLTFRLGVLISTRGESNNNQIQWKR